MEDVPPERIDDATAHQDAPSLLAETQALLAKALAQQQAAEALAGIGSYELDLRSGVLHFSAGLYRLFGEVPQSFSPSVAWLDARSDSEDVATVHRVLDQARHDQQPYHYTRHIRRADGQRRILESHGRVVCDAAGVAIRFEGVVEDKTEARQAAQERQASHELLRATIDSSLSMVQVFEAVRDERGEIVDFTWTLNNQASEQVNGNVIGQRLLALNPGVVESGIFDTFKQVVETGQPDQQERQYVHEQFDGWFHQSTVKLHDGVATTTADITARKRQEQEILRLKDDLAQRAADKYRTLFNAIDEGFSLFELLYDAQGTAVDYRFLEVNQAFERQTGLVDAVGQLGSVLAPPTEPHWLATYAQVVQTGQPVRFENYHAGTGRWYEAYAARLGGAGSRQVSAVFNDVTERKRREANLRFLNEVSDDLAQLTSLDETMRALCQKTGCYFRVGVCAFSPVDEAAGTIAFQYEWHRPDAISPTGVYRLTDYHSADVLQDMRAGRPEVVRDTAASPAPMAASLAALRIGAFVNVPLVRQGAWCCTLSLTTSEPRDWRPDELELLRELATRIWTRLERARAEAALRDSEARLQVAVDAAELGTFVWHVAEDRTEADARAFTHFGFPPDTAATLSESLARIFHPEDGPRYVEAIGRAIDPAGPGTLHQEFRIRRPDGERWMSVTAITVFEGSPPVATRITGVLADITARKQQEQHQQFLLQLSDALRRLADPVEIKEAAARLLGEHLAVDRAAYAELLPDGEHMVTEGGWVRAGVSSIAGVYRVVEFGAFFAGLLEGAVAVIEDAQADATVQSYESTWGLLGIRAAIACPLLKRGRLASVVYVHSIAPRRWSAAETALIAEVGERTWDAVERARAEEAVQQSKANYRTLFESIDEGFCVFELQFDDQGNAVDWLYREANPAFEKQTGYVHAVGQRISDLQPDLERSWFEQFTAVARTGEPVRFVQASEAMKRWYDVYAFRVGEAGEHRVALLFTDISDRKRTEAALRESEEKFRGLFQSMREGFAISELIRDERGQAIDYRLLLFNAAYEQFAGLSTAQSVGRTAKELYAKELYPGLGDWDVAIYAGVVESGEQLRFESYSEELGRWYSVLAFPLGGDRYGLLYDDITARKHHAQRQQFLLQLSDRLRPLADPLAVQQAALQWVSEQLSLDRLLFNEIDSDVTTYTVRASYVREGFLAYGGQQPMGPFTESVRALQQGITKVVYDVETDESFSAEEKAICADIQVRAFVVVPLVKGGRWLINLVAHASQPRPWPAHEVALLEETAERTWAAVEQTKVEEALRASEAELHSFVTASSDTLYRMSADWQQMHSLQSKDFMVPTTAPSETWLTRYIPPVDQPAVQTAVQAAIAGRHFFELEHRVFRADGAVGWTFSRAVPVLGPQGELVEWFGTASDITARKTAEDAQHRSEERLRLALDAAELGTWDWDIDANEVRWNDRHFIMLGLEPRPGPLTPDDFVRTIHPDDRPDVLRRLQAAVADNHLFEAEFRVLTPQEEIRWMSGHGQASDVAPDGRVRRMSGVMLDVTERKHAEQHLQALAASLERKVARRTQALQENQLLLQSVYDTTLVGLAVLHAVRDEATGAITDFTFISVNKELTRLSGRPDLVGRRYGPEFPGGEASAMLARMAQAVETGQPQQSEFFYSVAGVLRWAAFMCVKLDGGVVATLLDITERKQAEQERTRNLHLLEQAETVAQLGSWDYDLATGQFYWSGGMYDLFGLPLGQPVQPPIYLDYVLAEDRPQAEQLVRQITTGAGDFETTLRLQVGEAVKTVRIKAVVLRDAARQAVRVLGVDLDLSELQRLEADNLRLRLSQQQALFEAVQAAEEEERRRMSESLHNGIGQILYATKLQLDRLPDAPELPPLRKATDLLSEAIRQTRALSHELTPAILEQFGLEKTLQSICSSLNTPSLRWRCHLEFEETPPLPMSLQLAVYRLAQELAQNVLKHAQATEAMLEVDVLPAWVVLRVEDNGQGFDPAHTSDGLGLRSLRSRAALLGGSVHLTTEPGQGTQCQIRIPLPLPAP